MENIFKIDDFCNFITQKDKLKKLMVKIKLKFSKLNRNKIYNH